MVKELIQNGAEINAMTRLDGEEYSCFMFACMKEFFKIALYLLECGANPSFGHIETQTFVVCLVLGENELVKKMVECGEWKLDSEMLIIATKACNEEVIRGYIYHGGDINAMNEDGETALHISVSSSYGDFETLKLLLSSGADVCLFIPYLK